MPRKRLQSKKERGQRPRTLRKEDKKAQILARKQAARARKKAKQAEQQGN